MTYPEYSPKTPHAETGFFARLWAFLRDPGSNASASILCARPGAWSTHSPARRVGRGGYSRLTFLPIALLLVLLVMPTHALAEEEKPGPPTVHDLNTFDVHATRAGFGTTSIYPQGAETQWRIEYATENGLWTLAKSGTIEPGDTSVGIDVYHLLPQTSYYARIVAENVHGVATAETRFTTTPVSAPEFLVPTPGTQCFGDQICSKELPSPTSFDFKAKIDTSGAETKYHFEYSAEGGLWKPLPELTGQITVAEDFATTLEAHLEELSPETHYYIRGVAENEKGTSIANATFQTHTSHPEASTNLGVASNVGANSALLKGYVSPNDYETHWRFEYATAEGGPWTVGSAGTIPQAEAGYIEGGDPIEADLTGLSPSTVYYVRLFAENATGSSTSSPPQGFESGGHPLAEAFAVHAIRGESLRILGSITPDGYDTHYRAQYVSQEQFGKTQWATATSTPELDAGEGMSHIEGRLRVFAPELIGVDLPDLQDGETYHYRLFASNEKGSFESKEQILTVPATSVPATEACPAEGFRTGLSTQLPDCRAYEQVTPIEKEGAAEPFTYQDLLGGGALVGEDGNHIVLDHAFTSWGPGQSPYFFARTPSGWNMTAGTPQPEAGLSSYVPEVYNPDLTQFGFVASWDNSRNPDGERTSPQLEFKLGPAGGPYPIAASVPSSSITRWVGASEDFGKLILQSEDHSLLGYPTGTTSGEDIYEYSEGQLHQINVLGGSPGTSISACGAQIAFGSAENTVNGNKTSTPHAVSADGSRVFFYDNCTHHLYMRVDGAETRDVGEYTFLAADATGSRLLLEKHSGQTYEFFLYDVDAASAKHLFSAHEERVSASLSVAEDFTAIYFRSTETLTSQAPVTDGRTEDLYRYDIPSETLGFVVQEVAGQSQFGGLSPNGLYYYFSAQQVGGLPVGNGGGEGQLFRYDSAQDVVECVSCASPFDPEPKMGLSPLISGTQGLMNNGLPRVTYISANGDYAFFATPAALLPQDLNGEIPPEPTSCKGGCSERPDGTPSTDIYEWRRDGLHGCAQLQGCLGLITTGTDGYFVGLIGTTASGRDVFFTTRSQLVPQDRDGAIDIYDARIGGGFRPPPPAAECEGDACSTPFAAPNDLTPSSFTFHGAGNVISGPAITTTAKGVHKKQKKKKRVAGKIHRRDRRVKRAANRYHGGVK